MMARLPGQELLRESHQEAVGIRDAFERRIESLEELQRDMASTEQLLAAELALTERKSGVESRRSPPPSPPRPSRPHTDHPRPMAVSTQVGTEAAEYESESKCGH